MLLAALRDERDGVPVVFVEKRQPIHHPRVQPIGRVTRDLTGHVKAVLEPLELATSRHREDCALAILAPISVARYVLAIESETRFSVV